MNSKNSVWITVAIGALSIGLFGGYWFANSQVENADPETASTEREPLFYRNPMNAEITSPVPAKDHMGMDYVPVYADMIFRRDG